MNLNVDEIVYQESSVRPLNSDRVAYYKKEFEQGRDVPPILVDNNLMLVDGAHRLTAARLLGHDTISAQLHIQTPLDLHNRAGIADAISRATTNALSRQPFVDRREASSIRVQVSNKKSQIAAQEGEQQKAEQYIVKLTGQLVSLRALDKKYRKLLDKSPHYAGLADETSLKIRRLEGDLEFAKKDLARIERIVASHKKLLAEFLSQTPGKGFPTNAELLEQQNEIKKLEAEAANELRAASF
jgi:hypothetical protein